MLLDFSYGVLDILDGCYGVKRSNFDNIILVILTAVQGGPTDASPYNIAQN